MTKRDQALALARIAGYHGDTAAYTRLLVERRVARPAMAQAYSTGARMKERGVPCACSDCACKQARHQL